MKQGLLINYTIGSLTHSLYKVDCYASTILSRLSYLPLFPSLHPMHTNSFLLLATLAGSVTSADAFRFRRNAKGQDLKKRGIDGKVKFDFDEEFRDPPEGGMYDQDSSFDFVDEFLQSSLSPAPASTTVSLLSTTSSWAAATSLSTAPLSSVSIHSSTTESSSITSLSISTPLSSAPATTSTLDCNGCEVCKDHECCRRISNNGNAVFKDGKCVIEMYCINLVDGDRDECCRRTYGADYIWSIERECCIIASNQIVKETVITTQWKACDICEVETKTLTTVQTQYECNDDCYVPQVVTAANTIPGVLPGIPTVPTASPNERKPENKPDERKPEVKNKISFFPFKSPEVKPAPKPTAVPNPAPNPAPKPAPNPAPKPNPEAKPVPKESCPPCIPVTQVKVETQQCVPVTHVKVETKKGADVVITHLKTVTVSTTVSNPAPAQTVTNVVTAPAPAPVRVTVTAPAQPVTVEKPVQQPPVTVSKLSTLTVPGPTVTETKIVTNQLPPVKEVVTRYIEKEVIKYRVMVPATEASQTVNLVLPTVCLTVEPVQVQVPMNCIMQSASLESNAECVVPTTLPSSDKRILDKVAIDHKFAGGSSSGGSSNRKATSGSGESRIGGGSGSNIGGGSGIGVNNQFNQTHIPVNWRNSTATTSATLATRTSSSNRVTSATGLAVATGDNDLKYSRKGNFEHSEESNSKHKQWSEFGSKSENNYKSNTKASEQEDLSIKKVDASFFGPPPDRAASAPTIDNDDSDFPQDSF